MAEMTIDQQKAIALATARLRLQQQQGTQAPQLSPEQADMVQGGTGAVNSAATGFINGLPVVGPYLKAGGDKVSAGVSSLINGLPYDENLKRVQNIENQTEQAHPNINTAGSIAGGVTGTTALAAMAPQAFGIGEGPILGRMAISALTGGALGGTDAAVRSDADPRSTMLGTGVGILAGGAGPAIGKAIGAGVRYFTNPNDAISGLSSGAQKYITNELSDPAKIAAQQSSLSRLGPDATLADVSPEWLGVARGAASRPGTRDAIVNALMERQSGANQRLATDLDANLGRAVVPSQIEQGLADSRNAVAQQYGPVMGNASRVDTQGLAGGLDAMTANLRGPEQRAIQQVRGYLNIPGTDALDPNPQALLASRQAIDGLLANETNPQVVRQLTMARQQVDGILASSAPGIKGVDAQYSELARQSDALQQGRPILNNGATALRPQEVEDMLFQGAQPQGQQIGPSAVPTRMQQGVRAEIDRATGTNAIDTTAARNIVRGEGDWNRQKLGMLFGQENADNALNAIDRETVFGDTANRVTRGSDTALAGRFGDFLDEAARGSEVPSDITLTGVAARGGKKLLSALVQQNASGNASRFADEIGRLAISSGTTRDQLVQALMARAQAGPSSLDPRMQAIINAVVQSAGRQTLR